MSDFKIDIAIVFEYEGNLYKRKGKDWFILYNPQWYGEELIPNEVIRVSDALKEEFNNAGKI